MWKIWGWTVIVSLLFFGGVTVQGTEWPAGISFVGLIEGQWKLHILLPDGSNPTIIETLSEPRTPTYHARTGNVSYIDADGRLRERSLETNSNRVLRSPNAHHTYTQPVYGYRGERLFVVVLKQGSSVDTDIMEVNAQQMRPVIQQRSAQFEPYFHPPNTLYYSNVICTIGCGTIIQELWRKNLISGQAEQLTMLNAIARQPVVSADGQDLYFSSNKAGNFHIWRLQLEQGRYEQLTSARVTDSSPALDSQGHVYFIRQSPDGTQLMRLSTDGTIIPMPLAQSIEDLRDLEIHQ